jgi:hypothetical protein
MLSSHVKIRVKRIGIWLVGCAPVAIQRRMGPHFSMSFCVSPLRTENWKNTEQTQNSKIPSGILLLGCLPGAPGCSFYGSLKFEKRTFLKKDPKLKKLKTSRYQYVLARHGRYTELRPPRFSKKNLNKVTKSDPETNSQKSVISFSGIRVAPSRGSVLKDTGILTMHSFLDVRARKSYWYSCGSF